MDRRLHCVSPGMGELFELVFEYRGLLAARRADESALSLPERQRLDALHLLLGREPVEAGETSEGDLGRRRHARCEVHLSADLRVKGHVMPVDVVNLGGGGVCVIASEPLDRGARAALRLRTPEKGQVWECIARAAWVSQDGERTLAGLRFVGAPVALRMAS